MHSTAFCEVWKTDSYYQSCTSRDKVQKMLPTSKERVLGTDIFTSIASFVVVFTLQKMLDIHYPEAFPSPKQLIA